MASPMLGAEQQAFLFLNDYYTTVNRCSTDQFEKLYPKMFSIWTHYSMWCTSKDTPQVAKSQFDTFLRGMTNIYIYIVYVCVIMLLNGVLSI